MPVYPGALCPLFPVPFSPPFPPFHIFTGGRGFFRRAGAAFAGQVAESPGDPITLRFRLDHLRQNLGQGRGTPRRTPAARPPALRHPSLKCRNSSRRPGACATAVRSRCHGRLRASVAGVRGHGSAYLIEQSLHTVQPSRDERWVLEVARNLEFLTSLGYLVGSHLPGAAFNGVGFRADVREIGGCQGSAHLLHSSIGISAESIDQPDDQAIIPGCRFQQHCRWRPGLPA